MRNEIHTPALRGLPTHPRRRDAVAPALAQAKAKGRSRSWKTGSVDCSGCASSKDTEVKFSHREMIVTRDHTSTTNRDIVVYLPRSESVKYGMDRQMVYLTQKEARMLILALERALK